MIPKLGSLFARWARIFVPDPLVFAIVLTAVTFLLALVLTEAGPKDIVLAWVGDRGVFNLLTFAMQMCLILVTGHVLASSKPVAWLISRLTQLGTTPRRATALVALVAVLAGLINWGLGLVVGALLAREMGRSCLQRGVKVHYPLLAAAGYTGLLVWHGGFSGSAPLTVTRLADLNKLLGPELAAQVGEISLSQTLLSPMNLVVAGVLVLLVPLICSALLPAKGERQTISDFPGADVETPQTPQVQRPTPAQRLEQSRITGLVLFALVLVAAIFVVQKSGLLRLHLNAVILIFFGLGLLAHGSPSRYMDAVKGAISGCAGIVIQFPLYAGIMGIMAGTGLVDVFANGVVEIASATTYPVFNFFSAAVVNFFVPSGGGQWAVQGPISVKAALQLGLDVDTAVMSLAYGDQMTNMLQPFWALPLLGITGVRAHHVIGYTAVLMVLTMPVFILALLLFA